MERWNFALIKQHHCILIKELDVTFNLELP